MNFFKRRVGSPPKFLLMMMSLIVVLAVACPSGTEPGVPIDIIDCPQTLSPGDECDFSGNNLDLITEMKLGNGSLRIPVSHRGGNTSVVFTIPTGISPGGYGIFYATRDDSDVDTGRIIVVSGIAPTPAPTPVNTPTPRIVTPTFTPTIVTPTFTPEPTTETTSGGIIKIAELPWDSGKIQAGIVGFILEEGYGFQPEIVTGGTSELFNQLLDAEIDVYLEAWDTSLGMEFDEAERAGQIIPLGTSLDESWQSTFVVPTYVIKGDPSRGLAPLAPDLKTPEDIRKYQDLFATPVTSPKARLVSCIASWSCAGFNEEKIAGYGLEDVIKLVTPSSAGELFDSLESAYANREPWLGYLWGPTPPSATRDLTRLTEATYTEDCWGSEKTCEYEISTIRKAVHPSLLTRAAPVIEFIRQWNLDAATQVDLEAFLGEVGVSLNDTIQRYLTNNEDTWTGWVPSDVADDVKAAMKK